MMIGLLLSLGRAIELRPSEIHNLEFNIQFGENKTFQFDLRELAPESIYELRVSCPGTSPIKPFFSANGVMDTSDEKVVFKAVQPESSISLTIQGIGVSGNPALSYTVPLNISLEKQYYGLTSPVLSVICYLVVFLLAANVLMFLIFPSN